MAASLRPLGDQHVGAGAQCLLGQRLALHLADHQRTRRLDRRREGLGIAERQHDRAGTGFEREVEDLRLLRQAPGDEPDAERRRPRRLKLSQAGQLAGQPIAVAIAGAQYAEPAGLADGGGQPRAGHEVHRRQQDRVRDAELARECVGESHGLPFQMRLRSTSLLAADMVLRK